MNSVGMSERKSCLILEYNRQSIRYQSKTNAVNEAIRDRLKELSKKHPSNGCPLLTVLIRKEFGKINHKRIERIYLQERLQLPRHRKKKYIKMPRKPLKASKKPNETWSMDFVHDRTYDGRKLRMLNVIDNFTRECLWIAVDRSLNSNKVTCVLDYLKTTIGLPESIRIDNGAEFTSKRFQSWSKENNVELDFIEPGKPMQNGYIESFNGKFRAECLNLHWFRNLDHAREEVEKWRYSYNQKRPHSSLDYKTPYEFRLEYEACITESLTLNLV